MKESNLFEGRSDDSGKIERIAGLSSEEIYKIAEKAKIREIREERKEMERDPVLKTMTEKAGNLRAIEKAIGALFFDFAVYLKKGETLEEATERQKKLIEEYCEKYGREMPTSREEAKTFLEEIEKGLESINNAIPRLLKNPQSRNLLKEGAGTNVRRKTGEIEEGWKVEWFDGLCVFARNREGNLKKGTYVNEALDNNGAP